MSKDLTILLWFAAAWGLLYVLHLPFKGALRKRGITVYPLAVVWRLRTDLSRLTAASRSKIVGAYGTLSVVLTLLSMLLFYFFVINIVSARYFRGVSETGGLVPIIPGLTIDWGVLPYLLLAIGVAVIFHELAHALLALRENVPIKSVGLFLAFLIPAAFVEVDNDRMRRLRPSSRMKIVSAGPASNLILGLAFYALLFLVTMAPNGVLVTEVFPGSPADRAGLMPGDVIVKINNTDVDSIVKLRSMVTGVANETQFFVISVLREGETLILTARKPPGEMYLGIGVKPTGPLGALSPDQYSALLDFINYTLVINLSLALINAAPLFVTDGSHILRAVLEGKGLRGELVAIVIQASTLAMVVSVIYIP